MRLSHIWNTKDADLQQWTMHSGTSAHLFIKSKCFLETNYKGQILLLFHTQQRLQWWAAPVSIAKQRAAESALKPVNVKRCSENIAAGQRRHCQWYATREWSIRSKGQNFWKKGETNSLLSEVHTFTNYIKHMTEFTRSSFHFLISRITQNQCCLLPVRWNQQRSAAVHHGRVKNRPLTVYLLLNYFF